MICIPVEPPMTEYLHQKASAMRIPLSGTFELTPVCNMNCKMCYVRLSRQQQEAIHPLLSAEAWLKIGQEAKDHGMLYLLLTGGEPFLRSDFQKILSGLHRMGFVISINSNGTLIDESVIPWLKESTPSRINITLYGASDATYERLCGNPRGFTQVTKAIELLRQAGLCVKINCSVTPHNASDLEDIFAYCKREQLLIQPTSYMFPPLRKDASKVGQNDRFTPAEAAYYSAKVEALLGGEENFLSKLKENNPNDLTVETDDACLETEGEGIRCRAGKCSFWITWDGKLLPCGMLTNCGQEDVCKVGFQRAWEQAVSDASDIRLPAECKSCKLRKQCKACAAMVYTETGTFCNVPDYRCQMAHEYPKACRQLGKEIQNRGK